MYIYCYNTCYKISYFWFILSFPEVSHNTVIGFGVPSQWDCTRWTLALEWRRSSSIQSGVVGGPNVNQYLEIKMKHTMSIGYFYRL